MNNRKYHNHIPAENAQTLTIKKGSKKRIEAQPLIYLQMVKWIFK